MRGLYAIADLAALAARRIDPLAFADAVLAARPAALQLRAKEAPPRDTLALLRALAPRCHGAGVPLVANDRPDLAVLAGCDAVHVGQDDMPVDRVRRIAPGLRVGVSTHSLEQLARALEARPWYVAFGPVFATATKRQADPVVGLAQLRAAHALAAAAEVPLVAIGGITRERTPEMIGAAEAVAVVADLLPPVVPVDAGMTAGEVLREVAARARALHGWDVRRAAVGAER